MRQKHQSFSNTCCPPTLFTSAKTGPPARYAAATTAPQRRTAPSGFTWRRSLSKAPRPGEAGSPGVRFGGVAAGAREDAVELLQGVRRELDRKRPQRLVQLVRGARADDRRGDRLLVQQPGQ